MNQPAFTKIISANNILQGSVRLSVTPCGLVGGVGGNGNRETLRAITNPVDVTVISAKYLDRFTNENGYSS